MTKRFSATPYLFLAPALILIAVFVLYPIGAVVYYSFTSWDIVRPPVFIGIDNYQQLLGDATFWKALTHSIVYLIVTPTIIAMSIVWPSSSTAAARHPHLPGAVLRARGQREHCDRDCLALPVRPERDRQQHPDHPGRDPRPDPVAVRSGPCPADRDAPDDLGGVGYYSVIFLAGLQNISEELYDAAVIDGCTDFQKHWHVSLPGLRPQIAFVAVISSLAALKVFDEIYVLTNRTGGVLDSATTIVFYLWKEAFVNEHAGYAAAIAIVLLALTLTFSIVNVRLLERGQERV